MRPLLGLRHDVARRHPDELPVEARERLLDEHPRERVEALLPLRALLLALDAEAAELGLRRRLAGAELDPPAGDQVERGGALGDPRRVVERGRQLHDAVTQPDALRPLRRGRKEHLRRARVRVLLEEVVLDLPDVVEAHAVGQLDLLESVAQQLLVRAVLPRPRHLVLVEDPEAHPPRGRYRSTAPRAPLRAPARARARRSPSRSRRGTRASPSGGRATRSRATARRHSAAARTSRRRAAARPGSRPRARARSAPWP